MSELVEYIRSMNDNRVIGMMKSYKYKDAIFISWSKYNEDKENFKTHPFDNKLMREIVEQRFELWITGVESCKLIPIEIQPQLNRFVARCKLYYKDATSFHVFGKDYAKVTTSRINRILRKPLSDNYCLVVKD